MFKNKSVLSYIAWGIIGLFVVLVAVQSNKPYVLDEAEFPMVGYETSKTGIPVYYHGEQETQHLGIYHPTLYINVLALFLKVFGYSEISVRAFGAICVLLSAFLLIQVYRRLYKADRRLELLFLGLFLLNPFTIANATLPDIDSTILPIVILLFVLGSIRYVLKTKVWSNRVVLILACLFTLALWTKLTTPLILPPLLACIAYISSKRVKESLILTTKVTLAGALLFVTTYFIYCLVLGLSTTYTYTFLVASFTKGTSTEGPLVGVMHNLDNLRYFVYWITIPLLTIIGIASTRFLLDKSSSSEDKVAKVLIMMSLLTTIFYIALMSPFGGFFKYPFAVFGLLLLSIIFFIHKYLDISKLNYMYAFIALSLGFVIEKIFWEDSMFLSLKPFEFLPVVLAIIVVFYFLLTKLVSRKTLLSTFMLFLIFFAIGFQFSISRIQALSSYPTKYLYGQSGLQDTAEYLRSNTTSDEIIWGMKDIGYYVNNKYHESYAFYFNESGKDDLLKIIKERKIRYYVATTGIGQDNIDYYTHIRNVLDTYTVKDKQFGNFVIYKLKD